jgi:tetratricopeptide (TPR) repeat protein
MSSQSELGDALRLKRAGHLDQAVIALEALLAHQPTNAIALSNLAEVQLRRRRLTEAAECLDRAEAAAGTTAMTARLRGDLSYKRRRYSDAARSYREADALGDRGTWSLVGLARSCLHSGDHEGARGAASKATERAPGDPAGWLALGEIAMAEKRLPEAEKFFQRAHEASPKDKYAYAELVRARVMQMPKEERAAEVEVLLRTTGKGNSHLQRLLGKLQKDEGDLDKAAKTLAQAVQSGDAYSRSAYAFSLKTAGRLDEAARALAQCLADDPADPVIFRHYVSLQKERDALEELRSTLEELLPRAGERRGAFLGALKTLPIAGQ